MKTKIFNSRWSFQDLEEQINNFVGESEIVNVFVSAHNMHDLFDDGTVCNQWEEYVAVLIYK